MATVDELLAQADNVIAKASKKTASQAKGKEVPPPSQAGKAIGLGLSQGATMGFGEELGAPVEKAIGLADVLKTRFPRAAEAVSNLPIPGAGFIKLLPGDEEAGKRVLAQPTAELIRESRKELHEVEKSNPILYGGSKILGGALATGPFAPQGALARLGLAGALGGTTAAGESEKQGLELAKDVAKGTGVGLLAGGVFEGLGRGVVKTATALKDDAIALARRAIGFNKSLINKVGGLDKANKAATTLFERGAIRPFADVKDIAENVHGMREEAGQLIGDTLAEIDKVGKHTIDPVGIANEFKKEFQELVDEPIAKALKGPFEDILETLEKRGASMTFEQAQKLKGLFQRMGWGEGRELPGKDIFRAAYYKARDAIDNAIEAAAPSFKDPAQAKKFLDAKKVYQAAKTAEVAIEDTLKRLAGNRAIGLTDFILASGELAAGAPGTAVLVTLGKKAIESRGAATGAKILDLASRIATPVGTTLQRAGVPAAVGLSGALLGDRR